MPGCATQLLWDKTDPSEYLVMKRTPEVENQLRERGLNFRVYEEQNVLMVEKSKMRKFHDYVTRFFVTPITIVHDAAVVTAVVGAVAYVGARSGPGEERTDSESELKGLEKLMRDINNSRAPED